MKKLIIFDCDGVLVDSEIIASRISSQLLTSLGYPVSAEDEIRRFSGMNDKAVCQHIFQETGIDLSHDLLALSHQTMLEALEKELQPLMLPILSNDLLKQQAKCVASNSWRDRVLMSLRVTNQDQFFQTNHIFTASEVKNPKPAPDLFLLAAERMGYDPKNCLVIEDSLPGIQAARAAEMSVIGFLGATHAQFPWYQERIANQNIPLAQHATELLPLIKEFLADYHNI